MAATTARRHEAVFSGSQEEPRFCGCRTSLNTWQVTISADRTLLKINISGRIREAAKIGLATLEHLASAEDLDNIALTADDLRDTQVCQRSKITLSNIFSKVGTVEKAKEMIVFFFIFISTPEGHERGYIWRIIISFQSGSENID